MTLRINSLLNKNASSEDEQSYLRDIHPLVASGNRVDEAIKALEDFLLRYPQYAPAVNNLAVLYHDKGESEKALSLYEKAVELEGSNVGYLKNLADFYLIEAGRLEDALRLYVKALEIDSEDVEIFLILGNICAQLKNLDDARLFYNRALEIEPWNLTAMDNLDYLEQLDK